MIKNTLKFAISDYMDIMGAPKFVESFSNYPVVEEPLKNLGMSLRRKLVGYFGGKHVVAENTA